MSVDRLQDRIRKRKNPVVVQFSMLPEWIPPAFMGQDVSVPGAWEAYCKVLLDALKEQVPAVRFSVNQAAAFGPEGMIALKEVLRYATKAGFYVLLDAPAAFHADDANLSARNLSAGDWFFDGLVVTAYIGSDAIRPYVEVLEPLEKALFVVTRSHNRSCQELQDLLTGSRLVYQAMADVVNRFGQGANSRSGYSSVASVGAANAPDSLRLLREKYKYQFILVDGYDAPNANAKNCALAFDRLGHGAVVCSGIGVTGAWKEEPWSEADYVDAALEAVQRMKKNLSRYVTVL